MPSVVLSNIPHYHHLAEALHAGGLLARYITTFTLLDGERAPSWLPARLQRKLEGRHLRHVPAQLVKRIRTPEILQKVLPALRLCSADGGNWVNNHLFDRFAAASLIDCNIFHFVSSVGLYTARAAKRRGARIICDVRQEHPFFQRGILMEESERFGVPAVITGSSYEQKILDEFQLADCIIVPSEHARRTFLAAGLPADRLISVPYGVDLELFRPPETKSQSFRVLYSGSLTLRKGPQYLLEAFRQLADPAAELILAGPMDPQFQPILEKYSGLFRYVGVLPKVELNTLYGSGSVFVLPSLADSFSLGTLEAMACGLPVIVSENTGIAEFIQDGQHGFVIPIRDVAALTERLRFLRDHPGHTAAMGASAAARAHELTWRRYGSVMVDLHRQLASGTIPSHTPQQVVPANA